MQIDHLTQQIQSTRQELIQHPAFGWVNTLDKARDFMETHVWAVWDFMVLLKALQRDYWCGLHGSVSGTQRKGQHQASLFQRTSGNVSTRNAQELSFCSSAKM